MGTGMYLLFDINKKIENKMLFKSKNWGSFSYSFWYLTIYVYYKIIYIYDIFIIHNIFLFGYLTKK